MLWSTRHLFFGKVSEVHKDSIRSSQKHLFPQFRGVSGPMTQEWRIWTSASTPLFILLVLSTFLCMGGVACVCLSLATVYLLLFVWFVAFHVVFFSFFSLIVSFFPSSAALQFEGKGGRKRKTRWMKKWQTTKKTNQEDKGGIGRKTWNTKIKKHNKEEKQNRKEKDRPFVVFVVLGCWPLSGRNLARDKGPKTLWNKGFCCFSFYLLECCWAS